MFDKKTETTIFNEEYAIHDLKIDRNCTVQIRLQISQKVPDFLPQKERS